jgi:putative transposase
METLAASGKAVASRLRQLLAGKAKELRVAVLALDIAPDHVHLFIETSPRWSISLLIRQFKGYTSRTLRDEFPALRKNFPSLWASSYFAGSCGTVTQAAMRRYIQEQTRSLIASGLLVSTLVLRSVKPLDSIIDTTIKLRDPSFQPKRLWCASSLT